MAKEKVKKPIYKKWWFWLVIGLIVVGIGSNGGEETTQPTGSTKKETATSTTPAKKEAPKAEAKAGVLSEEKYNKIQNGMTYEEVVAIIGAEGKVLSETGDKGTDFHTVMYEWDTDGVFSNASMMFQGGKLVNKTQLGVVEESNVEVTLDEFNKLANGMTYEEASSIVGGEGTVLSETGEKGTDLYTVSYQYSGKGDLGANVMLMFQGEKLANKSQFGLK